MQEIQKKLKDTQKSIDKWTNEYKNGNISKRDYEQAIYLFTTREDILEWILE